MKTNRLRIGILVATTALVGCSSSEVSEVADASGVESFAAAAIAPGPTVLPESTAEINAGLTPEQPGENNQSRAEIEPFRNPFAPPKEPPPPVIEEPKPEPQLEVQPEPEPQPQPEPEPVQEIRRERTPPSVRLLGFMNIGEPKVLVSHGGELRTLAIGDIVE